MTKITWISNKSLTVSELKNLEEKEKRKKTFSDRLWTSAALHLLDELREGPDLEGISSTTASTPSCFLIHSNQINNKLLHSSSNFINNHTKQQQQQQKNSQFNYIFLKVRKVQIR